MDEELRNRRIRLEMDQAALEHEAVCMEILKQSEAALDTLEREYLEAVKKLPQEVLDMPLTKYREFDHEDRRAKITRRKRGPSPIRSMLGVTLIEVPDNVRELTGTEGKEEK